MSEKSKSPTARLFTFYVELSPLTQRVVAEQIGYNKSNIITMFKRGDTPIPINKIPIICEVLKIDPKRFLRTALAEYHPEMLSAIEQIQGAILTDEEAVLLKMVRERCDGGEMDVKSRTSLEAIGVMLDHICSEDA